MSEDALRRRRTVFLLIGAATLAAAVLWYRKTYGHRRAAIPHSTRKDLLESGIWENEPISEEDVSSHKPPFVPTRANAPSPAPPAEEINNVVSTAQAVAPAAKPAAAAAVPCIDLNGVKVPDILDGLGPFKVLQHNFITWFMKYYLGPKEASILMLVNRVWFQFASQDAHIWKRYVFQAHGGDFSFKSSWRRTYYLSRNRADDRPPLTHIEAPGFYSPRMIRRNYRANVDVMSFVSAEIPNGVPRRSGLSLGAFLHEYAYRRLPVIITDICPKWPAATEWRKDRLRACLATAKLIDIVSGEKYGDVKFRTAAHLNDKPVRMAMQDYLTYMANNHDEDPVYLFDRHFHERAPTMLNEFVVPEYFSEDLLSVLGENRPDHRWLVIGPKRSGTSFHIDPYLTSAWNALLAGRKLWLLFPPGDPPPGVRHRVNDDGEEHWDSPKPVKWFLEYRRLCPTAPLEVIQEAGELIYVPGGWWHMVLNLEDAIAVTQNIADTSNFALVWSDMGRSNSRHAEPWLQALYPLRPDLFASLGVIRPEIPVYGPRYFFLLILSPSHRPPPGVKLNIPEGTPIKYIDEMTLEKVEEIENAEKSNNLNPSKESAPVVAEAVPIAETKTAGATEEIENAAPVATPAAPSDA